MKYMPTKDKIKVLLRFLDKKGKTNYSKIARILREEIVYKDGRNDPFMDELLQKRLIEPIPQQNSSKTAAAP